MRYARSWMALVCVVVSWTNAVAAAAGTPTGDDAVPPYTPALEARLKPPPEPLLAVYRSGDKVLAFAGTKHVFTESNPTLLAVERAFAIASPQIVILEGFATAMGENPPPLVEEAHRRGTVDADDFAKGEAMYAASLALANRIPFIGGEPSRAEQAKALMSRGYPPDDILFVQIVGVLKQSIRAGSLTGVTDPRVRTTYEEWSTDLARDFGLKTRSFDEFTTWYRKDFGIDLSLDSGLASRTDTNGPDDPLTPIKRDSGVIRDEHLLAAIERLVISKKRVVVVYGSNHWVTLSAILKRRYGTPDIQP